MKPVLTNTTPHHSGAAHKAMCRTLRTGSPNHPPLHRNRLIISKSLTKYCSGNKFSAKNLIPHSALPFHLARQRRNGFVMRKKRCSL